MIYKVADRSGVVHFNVIGFTRLVILCERVSLRATISDTRRGFDLLPTSWRRLVDCMACLVRVAPLPWCGHGSGEAIYVCPTYDSLVRRQCYRCSGQP